MRRLPHYLLALALCLFNRVWGAPAERTTLIKFQHAPFPYKQNLQAGHSEPFFDVRQKGRRGHQSLRAGIYWEDETYSDNRVLISIPPQFNPAAAPLIVVYLHGNLATLERDVRDRQRVPEQLAKSGLNAILVAPQFAVDAQDSSPGHFADHDFFVKFLAEVADTTGDWQANHEYTRQLNKAKVVIVAYSGGYQAAAYALTNGGANGRIAGVVLLDALYGFEQNFADFILTHHQQSFFLSTFTEASASYNDNLQQILRTQGQSFSTSIPSVLRPGTLGFIRLDQDIDHHELVNHAWTNDPLADIFRRIK